MRGHHACKPFCGVVFNFGTTPVEQQKQIIENLFSNNSECLNYWREGPSILAYYTHPYRAAQIMETAKDHYYYMCYNQDKKSRKRQPHILKISTKNKDFVAKIIDQCNGSIIHENPAYIITYFNSPRKAAEAFLLLENYNIIAKFAKNKLVKDFVEMFNIETY